MIKTAAFNQDPLKVVKALNNEIFDFNIEKENSNIDPEVVNSFGEEWIKFNKFSDEEIQDTGRKYFDILNDQIINKDTYGIDVGCGTGRWTKYMIDKIGFMEAIDPSDAIFSADKLIGKKENIRLSRASTDNIPFADETFDFGMSVGVLHHIPDTQKALNDCVKKIKIGGYFYVYLYYSLEDKGFLFRKVFSVVNTLRKSVSSLPAKPKKLVCDLLAVGVYMPMVLAGRFLKLIGLKKTALKLPLSGYQDQTFFIIRNDALDRFGTSLEQRFSKIQVQDMMKNAGMDEIIVADTLPYWHAVGKRVK